MTPRFIKEEKLVVIKSFGKVSKIEQGSYNDLLLMMRISQYFKVENYNRFKMLLCSCYQYK